jgi:hypothetical protein
MYDEKKKIEELKNKLPMLEKIVENLVLKRVDVKHDFHVVENRYPHILMQFYLELDRMYKGSPIYDEDYKKVVNEIEMKINDTIKYAGLGLTEVGQHYTYTEMEYIDEVVKDCEDDLINILTMEYKIPYHLFEEYNITIQLNYTPDYPSDTTILAYSHSLGKSGWGTDSQFMDRGVDCDKLIEIVDIIFDKNGVKDSGFQYSNCMCEKCM